MDMTTNVTAPSDFRENSTWFTVTTEESRFLIHIMMTERCNLNCSYCYESHHGQAQIDYTKVWNRLTGILDRVQNIPVSIRYFGGEPLLAFDNIQQLTVDVQEYFETRNRSKQDLIFGITTNGTLLDERIKTWLDSHPEISLALSLDGTPDAHNLNRSNSYELIESNFPFFRQYRNPVKMTIGPDTVSQCAAGVKHIHDLGFECHANIVFEDVWGEGEEKAYYLAVFERQLAELVEYYSIHPEVRRSTLLPPLVMDLHQPKTARSYLTHLCGMGTNMTTIDVDGKEYPCNRLIPFYKAGRDPEINLKRKQFAPTLCRQCKLQPMCPECRAYNFEHGGNCNLKTTFHCEFVQLQLRASALLTFRDLLHHRTRDDFESLSVEDRDFLSKRLRTAQFIEGYTHELHQKIVRSQL